MNDRRRLLMVSSAWPLGLLAGTRGAPAQSSYPNQTIRIIVPVPPGSPLDTTARRLAEAMARRFGVPVIAENRPGAALTMGAAEVARATPNGYTLLVTVAEPLVSAVAVMKLPYEPQRDFKLISKVAMSTSGSVLVGSATIKAGNLAELLSECRTSVTPLSYASFGPGTNPQLILETLARQANLKFTEVPYKGSPPALADVVAGHVKLGVFGVQQAAPFVASGKIKAFAVMGRSAVLGQVQTFAEAGFDAFVFRNKPWIGLVGPARMPEAAVETLAAAVKSATGDAALQKSLAEAGFDPVGSSPSQFLDEYRAEMEVIPPLIRDLGVNPQ